MEREQRNALARGIVKARFLLEDEVQDQLEGEYNILEDGTIEDTAPGDPIIRSRLIELIRHHASAETSRAEAIARARRELAFTILNRFVALKLAEARGIVRETVSSGIESVGVQELAGCAPGLRQAFEDQGYRLLLETVMDEVSLGVGVLFDRRAATALIWPRPRVLQELLRILNDGSIASVWDSDETLGWIYQYFNADDVAQMRAESQSPRNSRELAVRNQFFTPRYVVQFLTDNTLGRTWYEMRKGSTALREQCEYMVFHQPEDFLEQGQDPSDARQEDQVPIPHRATKDPRDLRVLDPAVGSGHFLLYAFDLLLTIYEEAWEAGDTEPWSESGETLREDYPDRGTFLAAGPQLILHHNLYGIEIDARCAQIASFALWLRAQRAWAALSIHPSERPPIERAHIVIAEPIPADSTLLEDFKEDLEPSLLGRLLEEVIHEMRLAGDLGSLLKAEVSLERIVGEARRDADAAGLFREAGADAEFWQSAESALLDALRNYASSSRGLRRKMFAGDAEQGVALIDAVRQRYDVVLMNPPFGDPSDNAKKEFKKLYPATKNDIYAAFVERGLELLVPRGKLGAITSRTGFFLSSFRKWREEILLEKGQLSVMADLGLGVMDDAMVEAAAYCVEAF